jgi:hypothetical protein
MRQMGYREECLIQGFAELARYVPVILRWFASLSIIAHDVQQPTTNNQQPTFITSSKLVC